MIDIINEYNIQILAGCVAIIFILFIWNIINSVRTSKMIKKYTFFMQDMGDINMDKLLSKTIEKVYQIEEKDNNIDARFAEINNKLEKCVQKVHMVRYNAFEHVGSDLSFSLAILDEKDDGAVITGLFSRETSSIYAKAVKSGKSEHTLSEEEKEALGRAMGTIRDKEAEKIEKEEQKKAEKIEKAEEELLEELAKDREEKDIEELLS